MRIIAGTARGRHLKGPPRRRTPGPAGARPTTDMLRGALFSALDAAGADFSRVLDLYAGSGALGVEALSRGASHCDFVEKDRAMAALVSDNLEATGLAERAKVNVMPVEQAVRRLHGSYTLVLADPPYAGDSVWDALAAIARSPLAAPGATFAVEHASRQDPPTALGSFRLVKTIRHGDSAVSLYPDGGQEPGDDSRGGAPC